MRNGLKTTVTAKNTHKKATILKQRNFKILTHLRLRSCTKYVVFGFHDKWSRRLTVTAK